jgi:hypothetical protein
MPQTERPEKKEISGYASQMACRLLEDAVETEESSRPAAPAKPISEESHF